MRLTRSAQIVFAFVVALLFAGCGSGGLLNLNPQPTGNIVITNNSTGAVLQTTLVKPFMVAGGAFSIGITEDHFSGPYTISINTWTAPFSVPCFVSHYVDQTDKTNVVKFSPDNAAPVTTPTQPSPCNPFTGPTGLVQTDEETAQINDGKGHTATFFYQLTGPATGGSTTTPVATKLAISWSGPSPAGSACGVYVLNVGAVNASGTAAATTSANPITLSTTGGGYMGFSEASAASAGFACPSAAVSGTPPVGSPGGTATLNVTASPAQVLVYYNGFSSAATTTITANSVGLTPAVVTITNGAASTVASIKMAWNGAAPTPANCGAFSLNLQAFDASGVRIVSSAYNNPITLSTNSAIWSGFSTVVSAVSAAPAPNTLFCGTPGNIALGLIAVPPSVGTPTLAVPDTATPTVVYYAGPYATLTSPGAVTTITASAQGVPVQSITISF